MWTSWSSWRTGLRARSRGRWTCWRMTSACASCGSRRTAARAAPWRPERASSSPRRSPPDAIVVLDSDGQHDPERIPAFLDAARHADVVIGDRRDRRTMPLVRRAGNRAASLALLATARTWVPDTQNGMRLFRTASPARRAAARRRVRIREPPPALAARSGPPPGVGRDPHDLRGRAEQLSPGRTTRCRVARALAGPRRGRPEPSPSGGSCGGGGRGSPPVGPADRRLAARGDRARPGDARVPAARQRALPGRQRAW